MMELILKIAEDRQMIMLQSGQNSGVQERIKEINPKEFVACTNHSLNLDCVHAASVAVISVTFLGNCRPCFHIFFLSSTHPVGTVLIWSKCETHK